MMIDRLIEASLRNRFLVVAFFLLLGGWGYWALLTTPIDAIPDLSDNQVIIFTDWPGRSPQEGQGLRRTRQARRRRGGPRRGPGPGRPAVATRRRVMLPWRCPWLGPHRRARRLAQWTAAGDRTKESPPGMARGTACAGTADRFHGDTMGRVWYQWEEAGCGPGRGGCCSGTRSQQAKHRFARPRRRSHFSSSMMSSAWP